MFGESLGFFGFFAPLFFSLIRDLNKEEMMIICCILLMCLKTVQGRCMVRFDAREMKVIPVPAVIDVFAWGTRLNLSTMGDSRSPWPIRRNNARMRVDS